MSSELQPEEISARLGETPDESMAIGSRRRPEAPPRTHSTWIRRADLDGRQARPEVLEPVILGWGADFGQAVGRLVHSGVATASLEIVQEIRDLNDVQEKGIFISADLIAWLGVAMASLDIDQYIYHECAESGEDS